MEEREEAYRFLPQENEKYISFDDRLTCVRGGGALS